MKQHTMIYLKDWPELARIYTEWMVARKPKGFFSAFKKRDPDIEANFEKLFVSETERVVRRNIPIGRNPNDYSWQFHNSLLAVSWGVK